MASASVVSLAPIDTANELPQCAPEPGQPAGASGRLRRARDARSPSPASARIARARAGEEEHMRAMLAPHVGNEQDIVRFWELLEQLKPETFDSPPRGARAPPTSPPKDMAMKRAVEKGCGREAIRLLAAAERLARLAQAPAPPVGTP
jgi:hypothetical protein